MTINYGILFQSWIWSYIMVRKRQPTVALSSTEVEYRSATMAAQESTWLKQLMEDLHQSTEYQVRIFCDNLSIFHSFVRKSYLSCKDQTHRSSLSLHKRKGPWGWDHNGAYQDRGADCRHSHKKSQQSKVREVSRGTRHDLQDNIEKMFAFRGSVERRQVNLLEWFTLCKNNIFTME